MAQNTAVLRDYASRRDRLMQAAADVQETEGAIAEALFLHRPHDAELLTRDLEWLKLKKAAVQRRLDRLVERRLG